MYEQTLLGVWEEKIIDGKTKETNSYIKITERVCTSN